MSEEDTQDAEAARKPLKILLAPREIAGQMSLLAKGLRDKGHWATSAALLPSTQRPPLPDIVLAHKAGGVNQRRIRRMAFAAWAIPHFDVFHFFFGRSLLPRLFDLTLLRMRKVPVVCHFRGSDIRSQEWVKALADPAAPSVPKQTDKQKQLVERWRRHASAVLVSTPDLLELAPDSTWVPQAMDIPAWDAQTAPAEAQDRPSQGLRLVHLPSNSALKGTSALTNAVDTLKAKGAPITLTLLQGKPWLEVQREIRRADAGVDQLLIGWYGNAAIEMMAARLPVLCNVHESLKDRFAPDLPIVAATPQTIQRRLEDLIEMSPEERKRLGGLGRRYVETHHSLDMICDRLLTLYRSLV